MALRNASTSEQAKSDHENPLDSGIRLALSVRNQTRNRIRVDVTSILIERSVNQAIGPAPAAREALPGLIDGRAIRSWWAIGRALHASTCLHASAHNASKNWHSVVRVAPLAYRRIGVSAAQKLAMNR